MSPPPRLAVCVIERSAESSSGAAGSNPDSGMTKTRRPPSATSTRPPATIGSLQIDECEPDCRADSGECEDASDLRTALILAAEALLTDLVGEPASIAPLLNVQPKPMSAAAARINGTLVTRPVTTNEIPMIACATITDARRLYESATTPVGTSNRK